MGGDFKGGDLLDLMARLRGDARPYALATVVRTVAATSAKAGAKAAGVVIDDAAVPPKYVTGLPAARELPIIWKIARASFFNKLVILLPAALLAPLPKQPVQSPVAWADARDLMAVSAANVAEYRFAAARGLTKVAEAAVPLAGAEQARIIAFRPDDGGMEHLAIVVGEPKADEPLLLRLHSECFTGDLLGSLRCDCGDQLRGAIQAMAEAGAGIVLYLMQEGRGIGLVHKLRPYTPQDLGADPLDANEQLGFDADERVYLPAAQMLHQLGFRKVRLLTNNPQKVAALSRFGIAVEERVGHSFPSNGHNEFYLATKATRFGHLF